MLKLGFVPVAFYIPVFKILLDSVTSIPSGQCQEAKSILITSLSVNSFANQLKVASALDPRFHKTIYYTGEIVEFDYNNNAKLPFPRNEVEQMLNTISINNLFSPRNHSK